jgi:hypothetical protein
MTSLSVFTSTSSKIVTTPASNTKVNGNTTAILIIFRSLKTNRKDGLGVQLYPDGARYEGTFKDGLFHGWGKMSQANGDVYMGEW